MNSRLSLKRSEIFWLTGALIIGLLARLPGVWWGANFPGGWQFHHIDEYTHWVIGEHLLDRSKPMRWQPEYPKGTAVEAVAPLLAWRALRASRALNGELNAPAPGMLPIVLSGRLISVVYGTATILLVFLLGRKLFHDRRASLFAAWIMALGGLHVTQSHFFLADVPSLFWWLAGCYLLLVDFERPAGGAQHERAGASWIQAAWAQASLAGAAFAFGLALGLKLLVISLPSLAIAALWRKPRLLRGVMAGALLLLGFGLINVFSYGPADFLRSLSGSGVADACECSKAASLGMYILEAPSLISFPILILSLVGSFALARRYFRMGNRRRFWAIGVTVLLPLALYALSVLVTLDHFLRHLIPFIPWIALTAGWTLAWLTRWLESRLAGKRLAGALIVGAVFVYLLVFVFDGERVFIAEPRNRAAAWINQNAPLGGTFYWRMHRILPGYQSVDDPVTTPPVWLVMEMHHANQLLSGYGWKNSYPRDYRAVFDGLSQENLDWTQALFQGKGDYQQVARFREGYFMPEYLLVDRLLGDRSRNYVTEVVIFKKRN